VNYSKHHTIYHGVLTFILYFEYSKCDIILYRYNQAKQFNIIKEDPNAIIQKIERTSISKRNK